MSPQDKITAYEAYQIYLALKLHFAPGSYDATKYQFKVRSDPEKFRNKPEAFWFNSLAKKYTRQEIINALTANFIAGKKFGGMFEGAPFEETYTEWQKRTDALGYNFERELTLMNFLNEDFAGEGKDRIMILADLFEVKNGQVPLVIREYQRKNVSLETVVILDRLTGFVSKCNDKISDPIIWPKVRHLIDRYGKILDPIDRARFKQLLLTAFPLRIEEPQNG